MCLVIMGFFLPFLEIYFNNIRETINEKQWNFRVHSLVNILVFVLSTFFLI